MTKLNIIFQVLIGWQETCINVLKLWLQYILKRYKKQNEIENQSWYFLTGNKADIYKLARQSYFAEEDIGFSKDSTEFLHTEHFVLVDKTKRIRGIYNGTLTLEMQQLIEDIKILKTEQWENTTANIMFAKRRANVRNLDFYTFYKLFA